ncbi:MAG: TerC/Alx family metal homeostasis membrane protein [candidate division FCPU426 bacterium]
MSLWAWFLLPLVAILLLLLETRILQPPAASLSISRAWFLSAVWFALALLFNFFIYFYYSDPAIAAVSSLTPRQAARQFFAGFLLEKSLSLDNIYLIACIFASLRICLECQHRVLFWGLAGMITLRSLALAGGSFLVHRLLWIDYLFGLLLIATAVKLAVSRQGHLLPERNPAVWLSRRLFPSVADQAGGRFWVPSAGRPAATPLFAALLLVMTSNLLFAADTVPAIFAVTHDPWIAMTATLFSLLGLRSLYFALASLMSRLRFIRLSQVFLLLFLGLVLVLDPLRPLRPLTVLAVIGCLVAGGLLAAIFIAPRPGTDPASPLAQDLGQLAQVTYQGLRRLAVVLIGTTVLLAGLVMLITPGPGLLVIAAGLGILATEVAWARILLKRLKTETGTFMAKISRLITGGDSRHQR